MKEFAPEVERNDQGWILFPRDLDERRKLFPPEAIDHPAKMNLELVKAVVEYCTEPFDEILDPFGGTGSTAIAAQMGRSVTLIELEDSFVNILNSLNNYWNTTEFIGGLSYLLVTQGDSRQVLKEIEDDRYQLVLTSPPYPHFSLQASSGVIADRAESLNVEAYKGGPMNFSRITNQFLFNQQMKSIYAHIHRVLKPGGYYVAVTKDSIRDGKRVNLSAETMKLISAAGMTYTGEWFKWKTPMALGNAFNKSKGRKIVEDEDIIIFRK